jgi:hypothetical protein
MSFDPTLATSQRFASDLHVSPKHRAGLESKPHNRSPAKVFDRQNRLRSLNQATISRHGKVLNLCGDRNGEPLSCFTAASNKFINCLRLSYEAAARLEG